MKKIIIMLLSVLLITGCTSEEKEIFKNYKVKEGITTILEGVSIAPPDRIQVD